MKKNQSCLVSPTTWSNANHTWWVQVSVTEQFSRTGPSISNGPEWPGDCRTASVVDGFVSTLCLCSLFQSHPSPSHYSYICLPSWCVFKSLNKYSDIWIMIYIYCHLGPSSQVRFNINTNYRSHMVWSCSGQRPYPNISNTSLNSPPIGIGMKLSSSATIVEYWKSKLPMKYNIIIYIYIQ